METHARGKESCATRRANWFGRRATNIACTRISLLVDSLPPRESPSAVASKNRCRHAHHLLATTWLAITPLPQRFPRPPWHPSTLGSLGHSAPHSCDVRDSRFRARAVARHPTIPHDTYWSDKGVKRDRTDRSIGTLSSLERARTGAPARNTGYEKRGDSFLCPSFLLRDR